MVRNNGLARMRMRLLRYFLHSLPSAFKLHIHKLCACFNCQKQHFFPLLLRKLPCAARCNEGNGLREYLSYLLRTWLSLQCINAHFRKGKPFQCPYAFLQCFFRNAYVNFPFHKCSPISSSPICTTFAFPMPSSSTKLSIPRSIFLSLRIASSTASFCASAFSSAPAFCISAPASRASIFVGNPAFFKSSSSLSASFCAIMPFATEIFAATHIPIATAFAWLIFPSLIFSSSFPTVCPKLSFLLSTFSVSSACTIFVFTTRQSCTAFSIAVLLSEST